jgi:hypothetical protein
MMLDVGFRLVLPLLLTIVTIAPCIPAHTVQRDMRGESPECPDDV